MDPEELELVRRAIVSRVTGDCEWDDRAARRVRADRDLRGLTPEGIKKQLREYVSSRPEVVLQVEETRAAYRDRRFYYKVILPVDEFTNGLFVEIILDDGDPQDPAVRIVNAHEQRH